MEEFITGNPKETKNIAKDFAKKLGEPIRQGALIIALEGELGSGKTTFVQGLAEGFRIKEPITSPSFVLIKKYKIGVADGVADESLRSGANFRSLFHIDCYRLEKSWQLQELGFEEIINNPKNLVAIEWAERVKDILPEDAIKIRFEHAGEDERKIKITEV